MPMIPDPVKQLIALVLGIVLLLAAPLSAWPAYKAFTSASASTGWPTVTGRVTASEIITRGTKQKPRVTYAYQVNGRPYTSSRIKFGDTTGNNPSAARRVTERYPAGTEVEVYYDPGLPGNAVLEPGAGGGTFFYLLIPVILLGVGGFLLYGWYTRRRVY